MNELVSGGTKRNNNTASQVNSSHVSSKRQIQRQMRRHAPRGLLVVDDVERMQIIGLLTLPA